MSEIQTQIEQARAQIAQCKEIVAQRDRMVKLTSNLDFQKLIVEGFCKDECARYTHLSTEPGMSKDDRVDALQAAQAAGHLKRWINAIIMMGNRAAKDMDDLEKMLEELRSLPDDEEA